MLPFAPVAPNPVSPRASQRIAFATLPPEVVRMVADEADGGGLVALSRLDRRCRAIAAPKLLLRAPNMLQPHSIARRPGLELLFDERLNGPDGRAIMAFNWHTMPNEGLMPELRHALESCRAGMAPGEQHALTWAYRAGVPLWPVALAFAFASGAQVSALNVIQANYAAFCGRQSVEVPDAQFGRNHPETARRLSLRELSFKECLFRPIITFGTYAQCRTIGSFAADVDAYYFIKNVVTTRHDPGQLLRAALPDYRARIDALPMDHAACLVDLATRHMRPGATIKSVLPSIRPPVRYFSMQHLLSHLYRNPWASAQDMTSILQYRWSAAEMAMLLVNAPSLGRGEMDEGSRAECTATLVNHALLYMNRKAILKAYFNQVSTYGLGDSRRLFGNERLQGSIDGLNHLRAMVQNKQLSLSVLISGEILAHFIEGCPLTMKLTKRKTLAFLEGARLANGLSLSREGVTQALSAAYTRCPNQYGIDAKMTSAHATGADLRRLRGDMTRASATSHYLDISGWLREQDAVTEPTVAAEEAIRLFARASSVEGGVQRLMFLEASGWIPSVNGHLPSVFEKSLQQFCRLHLVEAARQFKTLLRREALDVFAAQTA